jgi:hypothetical protein
MQQLDGKFNSHGVSVIGIDPCPKLESCQYHVKYSHHCYERTVKCAHNLEGGLEE